MRHITKIFSFIIVVTIYSCVSQDDFDKVQQENVLLKEKLEDIEFGSVRLLKQATEYFNNNQLDSAEGKLNLLISKHNEAIEALAGRKMLAKIAIAKIELEDLNSWTLAETSNDISKVENYISLHPKGKYVIGAIKKIDNLKSKNEQTAYNNAVNKNSSSIWTRFLEDYPNRNDIEEIKKEIIKDEINEITGSSDVGSLPSSYQTDNGYSENTTINISNNTSYILTVRYSGPDITSVSISPGNSKTVYLKSGNYQVGATAGSASKGGTESLHGNYTSSYSIETSTYRSRY